MLSFKQTDLQNRLTRPIEVMNWIILLGNFVVAWSLPLRKSEQTLLLLITGAAMLFSGLFYRVILPRYRSTKWVSLLGILGAVSIIASYDFLLKPYNTQTDTLYVALVAGAGLLGSRRFSLTVTLMTILGEAAVLMAHKDMHIIYLTTGLHVLTLAAVGLLTNFLASTIFKDAVTSSKENRYLATLFQAGMISARSTDLYRSLGQVAKMITHDAPVTTCQICLFDSDGKQLSTAGIYPIRTLPDWTPNICENYPLDTWPRLKQTLESGEILTLRREMLNEVDEKQFIADMFFSGVKSICLIPLIAKGKRLGIISVGEARSWDREPFTREKLDFLQTLANQIAATVYNTQLYKESQHRANLMAVLNEVGKAIGSTIEMDTLLELIYEQLSRVISTDTYYVSLYDAKENILDIRILIDAGQRFPPSRKIMGQGFASWVIENRQPLLVRHLSCEKDLLPVQPIQLGTERLSESWLGVPMVSRDECLGLLAIASYTANAFDEDDETLLSNLAAQAALAIDNARQHAAVKEQARRDSLTGVYNHGYFLERLHQAIEHAQENQSPVALIMLDIDYFKNYNDTYGHIVGDEVLRRLAQMIQAHIQPADFVGRWGGEEFAIALPGSTGSDANQVAQRFRNSLAELELFAHPGGANKPPKHIPSPTVSQGIACFPAQALSAGELVDVADQALYLAKGAGRDQVQQSDHQV